MLKITLYYLLRNKLIAGLMLAALTITFYFPILSNSLSSILYKEMMQRAQETPLIITAKGSRFLSVLNTIYFHTETLETIPYTVHEKLKGKKKLDSIPIYNAFRAKVNIGDDFKSIPIVATTHDYLKFRGLLIEEGETFIFPGEAIIGHKLAKMAGIKVGDKLLSEVSSIMNLNAIYPLKLKVTGILAENETEDDSTIFSPLKSGWIMSGLFHGHEKPKDLGENYVLEDKDDVTVMKKNVISYTEITQDNIDSFHFHGEKNELPLTSIIVVPEDDRTAVITAGRINAKGNYKAYRPNAVMEEFFGLIFAVHKIFNSYFILVMSAVICFIAIIIMISARLRRDEFETIKKIGGSRFFVSKLFVCEYGILLTVSVLCAAGLTAATLAILQNIYL